MVTILSSGCRLRAAVGTAAGRLRAPTRLESGSVVPLSHLADATPLSSRGRSKTALPAQFRGSPHMGSHGIVSDPTGPVSPVVVITVS